MVGGMGGKVSGSKMGHHDTTTDDESEEVFHKAPTPSQGPIMVRIVNLYIMIIVAHYLKSNIHSLTFLVPLT